MFGRESLPRPEGQGRHMARWDTRLGSKNNWVLHTRQSLGPGSGNIRGPVSDWPTFGDNQFSLAVVRGLTL